MKAARTIYLIRQTQLAIYSEMISRLEELSLTPTQFMVLALSSREGGLSAADLARRARVTPQSMNEIIAALDRKGLIKRRESPEHKRILLVTVTRAGEVIMAECNKLVDELEREYFNCFDSSELKLLRNLLLKFLDAQGNEGDSNLEIEEVQI